MDFRIVEREITQENVIILTIQIAPKDQIVFCYVLESWEGAFNYSTVDKQNNLISVQIAGDYSQEADEILEFLKKY
jgi:hypothetical protein